MKERNVLKAPQMYQVQRSLENDWDSLIAPGDHAQSEVAKLYTKRLNFPVTESNIEFATKCIGKVWPSKKAEAGRLMQNKTRMVAESLANLYELTGAPVPQDLKDYLENRVSLKD